LGIGRCNVLEKLALIIRIKFTGAHANAGNITIINVIKYSKNFRDNLKKLMGLRDICTVLHNYLPL